MKSFYLLALIVLIASSLRATETPEVDKYDARLKIVNEFYTDITVNIYRSDDPKAPQALRRQAHGRPIQLRASADTTLVFKDIKKTSFFWVDVTFRNKSTWSIEAIQLARGASETFTVRKDLFGVALSKDSESSFNDLMYDFYSDIVILEQNIENKDEQLKFLFGGLAIVTIDYEKGISNRVNYMESGILKREIRLDTVFSSGGVERYEYIFEDYFLLGRTNMVPGIRSFAGSSNPRGRLFRISYAIKGLESDINYEDNKELEQRWKAIQPPILKEIFLEDFIQAFQKSSAAERVEVREYNRASGFKLMSVEIDEYGPNPEKQGATVDLLTVNGPYFLQRERVFEDLQGERILALGYDGIGVDHTEWITQQAIAHLDKLIEARSEEPSYYLNKLNKLGIQGYYQINRAEYVDALKALKLEMQR